MKVRGWGLSPKPATYNFFFNNPSEMAIQHTCSQASTVMQAPDGSSLTGMTTNGKGELDRDPTKYGPQAYKAVVPEVGTVPGEFQIGLCVRQNNSSTGSQSPQATFSVVVV